MSNEFDDPRYVDPGRNNMAGLKAPKGPGFAERVTIGNDIVGRPVRGDAPMTTDPAQHGAPQPETRYQTGPEHARAGQQAGAAERDSGPGGIDAPRHASPRRPSYRGESQRKGWRSKPDREPSPAELGAEGKARRTRRRAADPCLGCSRAQDLSRIFGMTAEPQQATLAAARLLAEFNTYAGLVDALRARAQERPSRSGTRNSPPSVACRPGTPQKSWGL
jgi:hypothetical protein